jgi:hypothetical protein
MANETKTVTVAEGVLVYTGAGAHPFRAGETVPLPATHADELVAQNMVAHVTPPPMAQPERQAPFVPQPKPAGA